MRLNWFVVGHGQLVMRKDSSSRGSRFGKSEVLAAIRK
jgi:hypothetical protein